MREPRVPSRWFNGSSFAHRDSPRLVPRRRRPGTVCAMDLKSGYPYWTVKNGLLASFPALARDIRCDVAVVGAGITGALIAR